MKRLLCLLVFVAAPVSAQPIHGHPQKAAYASPAEWLTDSAQCHWSPSDNPPTSAIAHTHVDLTVPRYAELSGPIVLPFAVTLYHAAATTTFSTYVLRDGYDAVVSDVIWDDTGTTEPPVMRGDPQDVKIWRGHLTVTPLGHGWFEMDGVALTRFDNGTTSQTRLSEAFYGMADPTREDTSRWPGNGPGFLQAVCDNNSSTQPAGWGSINVAYGTVIPVAPFHQRWTADSGSANYGGLLPEDPTFELRADLDLHHGITGRSFPVESLTPIFGGDVFLTVLDADALGAGPHKVALIRNQTNGSDTAAILLVTTVVVDPNAPVVSLPPPFTPPPPVVTTPPPPPVVTWETIQPFFQRFGTEDRFRLCTTPDHCVELVVK